MTFVIIRVNSLFGHIVTAAISSLSCKRLVMIRSFIVHIAQNTHTCVGEETDNRPAKKQASFPMHVTRHSMIDWRINGISPIGGTLRHSSGCACGFVTVAVDYFAVYLTYVSLMECFDWFSKFIWVCVGLMSCSNAGTNFPGMKQKIDHNSIPWATRNTLNDSNGTSSKSIFQLEQDFALFLLLCVVRKIFQCIWKGTLRVHNAMSNRSWNRSNRLPLRSCVLCNSWNMN